jgi:motility quorum-sensing regulator/GCU-specific mRNA interferase toxin
LPLVERVRPRCKLSVDEAMVGAGRVRTRRGAREGAVALGLDFDGMRSVVMALTTTDFHKSMATHADHWV